MNTDTKKIISGLGVVAIVAIAIYGTYLPWRKSSLYITGTRAAQTATTLTDFEAAVRPSLEAPSPIGQNELVRNIAGMILSVVRNAGQNKELTAEAINFLNAYYEPILAYGKGPSFAQDLYVLGLINESAYLRTGEVDYLAKATTYFEEGYRRGPRRPQFLYGLFDVYRFAGHKEGVEKVVKEIFTYWPNDATIKAHYEKFIGASSTTP